MLLICFLDLLGKILSTLRAFVFRGVVLFSQLFDEDGTTFLSFDRLVLLIEKGVHQLAHIAHLFFFNRPEHSQFVLVIL